MKSYVVALILLTTICCTSKKVSESSARMSDASSSPLDGEYEFYAGAIDDGYLYYKLSLTQKGDDLSGSLFTGIYLSKNDQGYTIPAATMTSSITGRLGNDNEVILYLGMPTDTMRMDKNYKYPEPTKIFDEDANGDPVKGIQKAGLDFQWIHNGDTLLFTKMAAAKVQ